MRSGVNSVAHFQDQTISKFTTGDFLQQRIAELQSQIRSDEERLINYAKNNQILWLDANQNTVVDRLSGLNKQLLEAENERKMAQAAYRVNKEPGAADAMASGGTRDMENQLAALKQKREQLLVENTEKWPEVKSHRDRFSADRLVHRWGTAFIGSGWRCSSDSCKQVLAQSRETFAIGA